MGMGIPGDMRRPVSRRTILGALAAGAAFTIPALSGCAPQDESKLLKVSHQQWGSGTVMQTYLARVIDQFRQTNPDITVQIIPLVAAENDYFTKNELMMSSERTAPDLVYEDTFILKSDVAAGYLRPLQDYLATWQPWQDIYPASKDAVSADGIPYAIPTSTDTRALWYNQDLFEQAGLAREWNPSSWDDILQTARTIKSALPDVIPFNIFSGKAQGEKASMQGFEMLLYGTRSTLFTDTSQQWVIGSQGFRDSLSFIKTVFDEKLAPPLQNAMDPNLTETIYTNWLPQSTLAINLDGSWISSNWAEGAAGAWPEWSEVMGLTKMPTQQGQDPGAVTLAGGWSWAMPRLSRNPDLAWEFLQLLCNTENSTFFATTDNNITIRRDVAESQEYQSYSPTVGFFTSLMDFATYRPALAPYPQISAAIQSAMEQVMIGGSVDAAAAAYDATVTDIVGANNTVKEG